MSAQPAHIDVQLACVYGVPEPQAMAAWAAAAMAAERAERRALCLRVVDEAEMRALNSRWRGRDCSTNVLAFPGPQGGADAPLGDLALCAPVVAREAAAGGWRAHWAHLVVHGTLHLLGHDHLEEAGAALMEARESAILRGLGFACPYSGAAP